MIMRDVHERLYVKDPAWLPVFYSKEEQGYGRDGFGYLLGVGIDPKTEKSNKKGVYRTAIMYLQPGKQACKWASRGCLKGCLNTAGNPVYAKGKRLARRRRWKLFVENPLAFMARLITELRAFERKCKRDGVKPAVRLNGTSDLPWEKIAPWLFEMFPRIMFYDYTKGYERLGHTPTNYWLTLSRSEENDFEVGAALSRGFHVAIVLKGERPADWHGWPTEDGDADDLLFLRRGKVQVLKPKGKARQDRTGFVLHQLVG
jgi:hypothetical protein